MEQFLRESPLAIITTDHTGLIQNYNSKAMLYFGKRPAENIQELFAPDSQFDLEEMLTSPVNIVHTGYFKALRDQIFFAHVSTSRMEEQVCWFIQDKQKQIDLENRIRQYQNIPSEFGHDLNNLLTIIISAGELIQMDSQDEQIQEDIENILKASYRATTRIRSFMDFGRKQFSSRKILLLKDFLLENEPLLQNCLGDQNKLLLPNFEEDINICVPEASFRALLTHVCTHLRLHSSQESSFQVKVFESSIVQPFSSHHLGIAEGKYYILSFIEEDFPAEKQTLLSPKYITASKDEILGQIWEASLRCGGSFLQRIAPNRRRCVTIYLPNIN